MSPAPWRYNRETGDILAADGHYIGQACVDADAPCPEWDAAEIANAQLIEAAPDLLAACEDCLLIGTSPMGTLYDLRRAVMGTRGGRQSKRGRSPVTWRFPMDLLLTTLAALAPLALAGMVSLTLDVRFPVDGTATVVTEVTVREWPDAIHD